MPGWTADGADGWCATCIACELVALLVSAVGASAGPACAGPGSADECVQQGVSRVRTKMFAAPIRARTTSGTAIPRQFMATFASFCRGNVNKKNHSLTTIASPTEGIVIIFLSLSLPFAPLARTGNSYEKNLLFIDRPCSDHRRARRG